MNTNPPSPPPFPKEPNISKFCGCCIDYMLVAIDNPYQFCYTCGKKHKTDRISLNFNLKCSKCNYNSLFHPVLCCGPPQPCPDPCIFCRYSVLSLE